MSESGESTNEPIVTEKFEQDIDEVLQTEQHNMRVAEARRIEEEIRSNPESTDEEKMWAKEDRKSTLEAAGVIDKSEKQKDAEDELKKTLDAYKQQKNIPNEVEPATDIDDASTEQKIPPEIDRLYLNTGNGVYHFKDKPNQKALVIKDQKIQSPFGNKTIARSMVAIAEAKSWTELKVRGSTTFKRSVWLEASLKGMDVKGYKPDEKDLALLSQQQKAQSNEIINETENQKIKDSTITGTLVQHGKAPYQFNEKNNQSYFVTLKDANGKEHTTWGVDLERVMTENKIEPGQEISLKNEGRKPVTIKEPIRNEKGEITGHKEIQTNRNIWELKADKIRHSEPEDLAKEHPDLINEIAAIKVAEKFSQDKFNNTEDQQRFVSSVRENLAKNLEQGQQDISVKINEQQQVKQKTREEPSHER
ncbi:LPD7 domain-containing protein [sulfur-oxidizing endosymbiont of Gigantopelta aegis]|uniref:LPD7 domain-containing protein n=1 Tax=sulfur-oxidizing endosymbiont of Gigantopelta aegis TaxID=2794934 RepID=UPI0018DE8066|nr:LPD7 domain-containing protein [sulfur-oxidizing endosymbiont of Gigantopelta aegis]